MCVLLLFYNNANCQQFYKIPASIILPNEILGMGEGGNYSYKSNVSPTIKVDLFEISKQITFAEYKLYLDAIKKDSSMEFYKKQLPDASIASEENYAKYISDKKYDAFAVAGISWDAAMEYCKWKTKTNADSGAYIYRLPKLTEWLSAYHFQEINNFPTDFSKNFSDWTMSIYYEGYYSYNSKTDTSFGLDNIFFSNQNDPPRLKRRVAIGDSYLYQRKYLVDHIRSRYAFSGYREISFRIVKEKISNKSTFNLNKSILRFWELDSATFLKSKTIL